MDENEIYDLTNIGTLSAFAIVCIGVLVLRYRDPSRPRPFRVPVIWAVSLLGASACLYVMKGLPTHAWERFGIWLAIHAKSSRFGSKVIKTESESGSSTSRIMDLRASLLRDDFPRPGGAESM